MRITEIFASIQGESSYAGLPCVFIRLAGCNLRCHWCDTPYARVDVDAFESSVEDVLNDVKRFGIRLVEITGGEPLMQEEAYGLAKRLADEGLKVLIETNGSVSLKGLDRRVVKIVDVKCPSSGHAGTFLLDNLGHLSEDDEVKFVIGNREDYDYARRFIAEYLEDAAVDVLFAPVKPDLDAGTLADWILKDGLNVRLQLQIHKYIWPEERGR